MAIPAARLRPGQQIFVRGKLTFSRLASLIDGEALTRRIKQERDRGSLYPTEVPHTTLSIVDAEVLYADANAPTQEEQYVAEKFYSLKSGDNAGKLGYGIDNKSKILPTVLAPNGDGTFSQLKLERDLASGLTVTLVLQVFTSGQYANKGIGLQQVVLMEEPQYYAGGGVDLGALAARGITVSGSIESVSAPDPAAAGSAAASENFANEAQRAGFDGAPLPNTTVTAQGFAAPTPGAQGTVPAPAPAAQAFPVVPAQPVVPVQQVAPAVASANQNDEIARLRAELEEKTRALGAQGGASAFDAPAATTDDGPWGVVGQASGAYQG